MSLYKINYNEEIFVNIFNLYIFSASFDRERINAKCCRGFTNDFSSYEK